MPKHFILAIAVLVFTFLSHTSIAQDSDESKLAPELRELSWLIGSYARVRTQDYYMVSNLRIESSDDGERLRATYRVGFMGCPPARVDITEEFRWNPNEKALGCNFTIEEVEGSFGGLNSRFRDSKIGKGTYVLKRVAEKKNSWSGKGTFTDVVGNSRDVAFSITRTDDGFTYSMKGEIYTFEREE